MRNLNFLKYPVARRRVHSLLQSLEGPIKLNIGCGTDYKQSWINIDNNSDKNIEKLDLSWDLRYPLPFGDNTIDFIYNEHFIEHLTPEESKKSISDFMRVIKPGGILRIAMPDMEDVFELYKDNNWRDRPIINNHGLHFVKTRAEMVNMSFSWWGHKWLYDWEELSRRLEEVGYAKKKIKRCNIRESSYIQLRDLETREGSLLIVEVIK